MFTDEEEHRGVEMTTFPQVKDYSDPLEVNPQKKFKTWQSMIKKTLSCLIRILWTKMNILPLTKLKLMLVKPPGTATDSSTQNLLY